MDSKKYILVTGGAGYIGSHTCKALAQAGYLPVVYDNLVYGHEWAVKWGPFEKGDIANRARLDKVITKYRASAVIHFAAYAYVGESVINPGKYYRNNVAGSLTILEAMRDHSIDKIIFSSTCATYGMPASIPIQEDHPQNPINPYGASKLMIERMLKDFHSAHDIRSIALRYFNAAGADPDIEIGEDHDLEQGMPSVAYNLGNGQGFSVKDVIDTASAVTGRKITAVIGPTRAGDPPRLVGDSRKITKELSWKPQYNDLEAIIETAWKWTSKNNKENRV